MPDTLSALPKGYKFPAARFDLSREWVDEYVEAVGDAAISELHADSSPPQVRLTSLTPGQGDIVPPMALAALSVRALLESAGLPPGSIHLSQEVAFLRAVRTGEKLAALAEVVSRGERQGWVLMGIDMRVSDAAGAPVMTGRAMLTFPLEGEA